MFLLRNKKMIVTKNSARHIVFSIGEKKIITDTETKTITETKK
jgi:hypothetical protein